MLQSICHINHRFKWGQRLKVEGQSNLTIFKTCREIRGSDPNSWTSIECTMMVIIVKEVLKSTRHWKIYQNKISVRRLKKNFKYCYGTTNLFRLNIGKNSSYKYRGNIVGCLKFVKISKQPFITENSSVDTFRDDCWKSNCLYHFIKWFFLMKIEILMVLDFSFRLTLDVWYLKIARKTIRDFWLVDNFYWETNSEMSLHR